MDASVSEGSDGSGGSEGNPDGASGVDRASRDAQAVRHNLQVAEHMYQCGDVARAADLYLSIASAYARHQLVEEASAICYRALHVEPSRFVLEGEIETMLRVLGRRAAPVAGYAAECHFAAGRGADAVHLARFAAEIDGRDPFRYVRAAEMMLAQHQFDAAVASLSIGGRRLLADGRHAQFVTLAEQILAIDAFHAPTLRELARTQVKLGDPHGAVARLAALMQVCPEDPAGYEILAHAFAVIGRVPKALAIVTRLIADLRADGDETGALDLLQRAKWWRNQDAAFQRALVALRTPPPAVTPQAEATPAREQTVMLSIDDIAIEIEPERDLEGTLILAIEDIAFVEASKRARPERRRQPTPPPLPRTKAAPPPPPSARRGTGAPAGRSETAVLQLSDIIFGEEAAASKRREDVDLPELLLDEESGLLSIIPGDDDTTVSRRRPTAATARPRRRQPTPPPAPAATPRRRPPPPPGRKR
jgi:tetratricopeptide (TPR) repeat protein